LARALEDENLRVRQTAAVALGQIGPEAAPAVPALVKTLAHSDDVLRRQAAAALGRIGPAAREALPALRKARQDEARIVRESATEAIPLIEAQTPSPSGRGPG
jgi:HEAT repeat protein